jgi:hypothetical protein
VTLKPNDIVLWHIPTVSGRLSKVMMVVRVEDGTIWLTDGYSEVGYVLGDNTFGELGPVPEEKAEHHRSLLRVLWQKERVMADQATIAEVLDPFDRLPLQCDGFIRVATFALKHAGMEHAVFSGSCKANGKVVEPHMWIQCGEWTVDYRLRKRAGLDAPHGVFRVNNHPGVSYEGKQIKLFVSKLVSTMLSEPSPAQEMAATKRES